MQIRSSGAVFSLALAVACSASDSPDGIPQFGNGASGASGAPAGVAGGSSQLGGASGGSGEGNPPVNGLNPTGNMAGNGQGGANSGTGGAQQAAGAGGNTPAGGAAGSSAGTAGAGNVVTPLDCGDPSLLFCEDFEADTANAFPAAPQWLAEAGGCGSHTVSGAVEAISGAQTLQATGAAYPGCMVHADVSGQDELYLRSWVRLGAPSTDSGHHVAVLELGPRSNQDDPEFRIGMRADAPCTNPGIDVTVGGLSAGERTECSGVDLNANTWYCIEAHVLKQNGSITFDVKVDGASVVAETTYTGLNAEWTDALFFKFGRASYGGNNTWNIWHDDVAVGTAPIGCD